MHVFIIIFAALILYPAVAGAIMVNQGDFVMLVERNLGILVHSEAGDDRVSLRFGSDEVVKVLSMDAETGWLLVRSSNEKSGWISAHMEMGRMMGAIESTGVRQSGRLTRTSAAPEDSIMEHGQPAF